MREEQEMVKDFHENFFHPVASKPQMLSRERLEKRLGWMLEELNELRNATTLDQQADALVDLIYFALGTCVEMGIDAATLFEIVHTANMTKLWPDGKPRFRKRDGKVIKPPGWMDPHKALKKELAHQIEGCQTKRG